MTDVTHKAIVVATQEMKLSYRPEPIVLKTWGPMCDPMGWVPGTQLERRDEKVTCSECLEKLEALEA
jgi:hypothetical protein